MMTYEISRELDEPTWRDFVVSNGGSIFQTPEMFEVFRRTALHEPELWVALDDSDKPAALFLTVDISVFGAAPLRHLSTRSVALGGAVAREGGDGIAALDALLEAYGSRKKRPLFTEFRNVVDSSHLQEALEPRGATYEDHLNFLIDLEVPEDEMWSRVTSSARRNIRKAQRAGVEIAPVADRSRIPEVYEVLVDTYRRIQVPLPDFSLFEAAFDVLTPRKELQVLGAFYEGDLIATLFLLVHQDVATYWYTGSLREHGTLRANDLLAWESIRAAALAGASVFDFGGAGKPDEDYGVRDFKAKYGGELVNFGRNVMVHSPLRLRVSTAAYERLSKYL